MSDMLYQELQDILTAKLHTLEDKPEETISATLNALWFAAMGKPMSAQLAAQYTNQSALPDLNQEQTALLRSLCEKRLQGIPLAHITGRQQFMGLELQTNADALIPRKETEILARTALTLMESLAHSQDQIKIIDVCTGAGNLPVSYAHYQPRARVFAADLSPEATALACSNVEFHQLQDRVEVKTGNLLDPFDEAAFYHSVDLITCNPPYISSAKVAAMETEISDHEPRLAFDGGPFGIKILNALIQQAPKYLRQQGWLAFEVGLGQGPSMIKVVTKCGHYQKVSPVEDDKGQIRVVTAQV